MRERREWWKQVHPSLVFLSCVRVPLWVQRKAHLLAVLLGSQGEDQLPQQRAPLFATVAALLLHPRKVSWGCVNHGWKAGSEGSHSPFGRVVESRIGTHFYSMLLVL